MSNKLFLIFAALLSVAAGQRIRVNSSIALPLHYDVELTVDSNAKTFTSTVAILIAVLEDTNNFELFQSGLIHGWLSGTRAISEDGEESIPNAVSFIVGTDHFSVHFYTVFQAGHNYTLQFTDVRGAFGGGLVVEPSWRENETLQFNYLLSTGFRATNLRRLFPCFDQPEFRSTYKFTIYHQYDYGLITNVKDVVREGPLAEMNMIMRSTFAIYLPLPTTSIGFALTNMPVQSSTVSRVKVYHSNEEIGRSLFYFYHQLLERVENELNVDPIPKLDIVYAPSLTSKFLVKYGVIFVGSEMSPVEDSPIYSVELKNIQKEISLSIYQLFFGQLINPEWWTDQWLTLGLARYFSGVTKNLPFDAEKEFISDTVQMVIREHTSSSGWMGKTYFYVEDIDNPNMFQVDQRAGALMRLIANLLGREVFTQAVLDLLKNHQNSVVSSDQFLAHLDSYPIPTVLPALISTVVKGYVNNYNPSSVTISVTMDEYYLTFSRFVTENVYIPIDFSTPWSPAAGIPNIWLTVNQREHMVLYYRDSETTDLWVAVNPELFGLYRVKYSDDVWAALTEQLMDNHEKYNRAQLITDSGILASEGYSKLENYLNLIQYLPQEEDVFAWRALRISYEDISRHMRGYDGNEDLFDNYFQNVTSEVYLRNRIQSEMQNFELTFEVAQVACSAGISGCVHDVEEYFEFAMESDGGLSGPKDFKKFIYCTLAKHSSNATKFADQVIETLKSDRYLSSQTQIKIQGLACSPDSELITRFLEIANYEPMLGDDYQLSTSERIFLFYTFMRGSRESELESLKFLFTHFENIQNRIKEEGMMELFTGMGKYIRTTPSLVVLNDINSNLKEKMSASMQSDLLGEAIVASNFIKISEDLQDQFRVWAGDEKPEPDHGSSIKGLNFFALVAVLFFVRRIFE